MIGEEWREPAGLSGVLGKGCYSGQSGEGLRARADLHLVAKGMELLAQGGVVVRQVPVRGKLLQVRPSRQL